MRTLLLTETDVQRLLRAVGIDRFMDALIVRLETAFCSVDSATEIPVRTGFHYDTPASGLIEWMPIKTPSGPMVIKVVGYHPSNPATHRLPSVISTLFAYDTTTGHLEAVMDGTLLTAMRTGAASAVASRWMARPDSCRLGLIGCGAQAVTQLHALSRLFTFEQVLIHDIDASAMASLAGTRARVSRQFHRHPRRHHRQHHAPTRTSFAPRRRWPWARGPWWTLWNASRGCTSMP